MCRRTTTRILCAIAVAVTLVVMQGLGFAQSGELDWRHIGNSAVQLGLPSVATGPIDRVWYSADGTVLYARTRSGRTYQTTDFEQWQRVADSMIAPPAAAAVPATSPEAGLKVSSQAAISSRMFAVGSNVYRSDDTGVSWSNLSAYQGVSILGGGLSDVAASPRDPDEVVVSSDNGVWRSVDAGVSWSGLNEFLPNLPAGHLESVPSGTQGV